MEDIRPLFDGDEVLGGDTGGGDTVDGRNPEPPGMYQTL